MGSEKVVVSQAGGTKVYCVDGALPVDEVEKIVWRHVSSLLKEMNIEPSERGSKAESLTRFIEE
jgi:hypothetical protein